MQSRPLLCVSDFRLDETLKNGLIQAGWVPVFFDSIAAASRQCRVGTYRVALLVLDAARPVECEQIRQIICTDRRCEWVAVLSRASVDSQACIELIIGYLFDHHTLPIDQSHLLHTLGHAYGRSSLQDACPGFGDPVQGETIVGRSAAIKLLMRQVGKVAATDAPVLIGGESGSGKELVAQAVHRRSRRAAGRFVAVNCGAISSTLIQAELFGAVRGAFTGAQRDRKGLLESADKGTILLDEIADLPLDMQTNLLRFLQEGTITPVGSTVSMHLDVRIIAATNVDLPSAVAQGRFRQDLFYRLNVLPLQVPPLRDRRDDIITLAELFFARHAKEGNPRLRGFSAAACRAMYAHDWPGNVRELVNRVRRALVMSDGRMIMPADLGLSAPAAFASIDALGRIRIDAERIAVCEALAQAGNNVTRAARALGVSRMTLYRMIERHQLDLNSPDEILR